MPWTTKSPRRKSNSPLFSKVLRRGKAKSRKANRRQHSRQFVHEPLEARQLLTVVTFQQGVGGYTGTHDLDLFSGTPDVNLGGDTVISVDQQDFNAARQGLVKFTGIFGSDPGQIPFGSTINSATLRLNVFNETNSSAQISVYRMLRDWDQNVDTWNSFRTQGPVGGVQASEGEAEALPDYVVPNPDKTNTSIIANWRQFDVAVSLKHWASGEGNFGWLFDTSTTNGWDFDTSESTNMPQLTVDFTPPSGAGTFQFLNLTPTETEGDSGTSTALLTVARLGGSTGAVSVDYTIAAGGSNPATAGTDFIAAGPTTISFADGETVKTVPVTINGDTALEGSETVSIALSNAQGGATIIGSASTAILTIADDDALINEVLANISTVGGNTTDETNREYIELIGTPGASLNGYQFVIFDGNGIASADGHEIGTALNVIDLSGKTFGTSGLLVITGTTWTYSLPTGTNQLATAALDGAGGRIGDSSQTYALIKSATVLTVGTDYDNNVYENNTSVAIGAGVGILDRVSAGGNFPDDADIVDSVGVNQGGGGDRSRVLTLAAPGVHVHEPLGDAVNGGAATVTPDAVTRRDGNKTPNSIGPWYDGEIETVVAPQVYAADPKRNVVTPAGAVITPGAANILRNVAFAVTALSVNESAGTATLAVTRLGDSSQAINVNYSTANGTATAGADYTGVTGGMLNFPAGSANDTQNITITILTDSVAEGFETFNVNLTGATSPYQIITATATVTINDANVLVKTFQDGAGGYTGTSDVTLNGVQPVDPFGFTTTVSVDESAGTNTLTNTRAAQALLRFDNLFGAAVGQVPAGAKIFGAFLTLNVTNPTAATTEVDLYRMLQNWDEGTATFADPQGSAGSSIANGVTPDDVGATAAPDSVVTSPSQAGSVSIPLNLDTIQAWADGSRANYGWAIISNAGDDWNFASSDGFDPSLSPKLTILYTDPTGGGTFGFTNDAFKVNESGTATLTVERIGGSTGPADVDYTIAPAAAAPGVTPASLADITGAATGTVHFNSGDLFGTITIPINHDSALEPNETLSVALSGAGLTFARPSATLTIRDDDFNTASPAVILNELYLNSPGNDGGHEFVELAGTAGAGMGSLYLAFIQGAAGFTIGLSTELIDIGGYANGSGGMTLVRARDTFNDWHTTSDVTQIATPLLNVENLPNDTASYLLLYSPNSSLPTGSVDFDWNNDGTLDLPAGVVIVDGLANRLAGPGETTYGATINTATTTHAYAPDAMSRFRGNTTVNSAAAWYYGDIQSIGDDPLLYHLANQDFVPSVGAAATPGEINAGTPAQSPLVSLTGVTPNLPAGTVTLTFNGPVTQVMHGSPGISLTVHPPGVDTIPQFSGLGTNTLTLTFTGASVINGQLPAGAYTLQFKGNNIMGNQRGLDVNNNGALEVDSTFVLDTATASFTQPSPGDVNQDTHVNIADVVGLETALTNLEGYAPLAPFTPAQRVTIADLSGDHLVNNLDLQSLIVLLANGGGSPAPGGGSLAPAANSSAASGPELSGAGGSAAAVVTTSLIVSSSEAALPLDVRDPVVCAAPNIAMLQSSQNNSCTMEAATTFMLAADANAAASVQASAADIRFDSARVSSSISPDTGPIRHYSNVSAQSPSAKYLAPSAVDLAISTNAGHHGRHSPSVADPDTDTSLSDFFELLA